MDFKPSIHCDKKFKPHRRVEKVIKLESNGLTTRLQGTCKECGKSRIYVEELKADFNKPIVCSAVLKTVIR
jgi:hypothetical protein